MIFLLLFLAVYMFLRTGTTRLQKLRGRTVRDARNARAQTIALAVCAPLGFVSPAVWFIGLWLLAGIAGVQFSRELRYRHQHTQYLRGHRPADGQLP